jgi:hypothetical protein
MTRHEFNCIMLSSKWKRDRSGNYKIRSSTLTYRLRMQPASLCYEILQPDGTRYKKGCEYFKRLTVVDGRLIIKEHSIPLMEKPD